MAKILVVDDEHLIVDMLSNFLVLMGHETISAMSSRQTWDRLAYEDPDAVLLDIMLPDDNGLNICRKLRQNGTTKDVPIIMVSAHFPPMTAEATAAGANGYLMKPVKLDQLKKALAEVGIK
jgi:CheY-like chemotaxis protein